MTHGTENETNKGRGTIFSVFAKAGIRFFSDVMTTARALYRRVLRIARSWEVAEEALYIRTEAREQLELARGLTGAKDIAAAVAAAEDRIAIALHYKIPYPRHDHLPGGGAEGVRTGHALRARSNAPKVAVGVRKRVNENGATRWQV